MKVSADSQMTPMSTAFGQVGHRLSAEIAIEFCC